MRKIKLFQKNKTHKSIFVRNLTLIFVCGVLAISSIFMTIETATSGIEISKLEKTEVVLSNQKRDLEESLVRTLSVSGLQEKSSDFGFVKPSVMVYVSSIQPVAKLP